MDNKTSSLPVISKPMVERIIEATCLYFGITPDVLFHKSTAQDIVYYRKIAYTLIRENCSISYGRIAQRFGFSDHHNIMNHVEEMQAHRRIYPQTRHDLEKILSISNNIDAIISRT